MPPTSRWPSGVKREMRDHLDEFLLRDTVLDCVRKVKAHLLGLARGDQRRTSYQAAVALRELRSLPYVTEQNVFGEVDELGRELTKRVARGWLGGHIVFLSGSTCILLTLPQTQCVERSVVGQLLAASRRVSLARPFKAG